MTTPAMPYCIDEKPLKFYSRILGEFPNAMHARLFASLLIEAGEDVAVTGGINHLFAVRAAE